MSTLRPEFSNDLDKFRQIAARALLITSADELSDKASDAVAQFINAINGAPRNEAVLAMLTIIRMFVEDWRADELALARKPN